MLVDLAEAMRGRRAIVAVPVTPRLVSLLVS